MPYDDKVVLPQIAQLHHHQVLVDGHHAVHLGNLVLDFPPASCKDFIMFVRINNEALLGENE